MRNFAMLGKWHVHAEGYARELNSLPDCRITKVWDADETAAKAWAESLGCQSATVEEILSDASIEGVLVCNATNEHTDLILRACRAGKAVFTEKVLALTLKEAEAIREAVQANGTRFAISFPHLSEPWTCFALDTARSGKLGKLNYVRVRKAHNGATGNWLPPHFYDPIACGGGAMVDLGAHPMYLLCDFLGEPRFVQSAFTFVTGKAVEDNAVCTVRFDGGAIGVSETGFVSSGYPFIIEVGGEKGTLLVREREVTYRCEETEGKWVTPALPEALPSPLAEWALAHSAAEIRPEIGIDDAVRLTRLMEAAYAPDASRGKEI